VEGLGQIRYGKKIPLAKSEEKFGLRGGRTEAQVNVQNVPLDHNLGEGGEERGEENNQDISTPRRKRIGNGTGDEGPQLS